MSVNGNLLVYTKRYPDLVLFFDNCSHIMGLQHLGSHRLEIQPIKMELHVLVISHNIISWEYPFKCNYNQQFHPCMNSYCSWEAKKHVGSWTPYYHCFQFIYHLIPLTSIWSCQMIRSCGHLSLLIVDITERKNLSHTSPSPGRTWGICCRVVGRRVESWEISRKHLQAPKV